MTRRHPCACPSCVNDASFDLPSAWPDPTAPLSRSAPIAALHLSAHATNSLLRHHLRTVADVERLSRRELLALRGFGVTCYAELCRALGRPEEPPPLPAKRLPPVVRWDETPVDQRSPSRWNVRHWHGCQAATKWPHRTYQHGAWFDWVWLRCGNEPMAGHDLCGTHQRRLEQQTA